MNQFEELKKKRWICLILFCVVNFCTGALYIWSVFAGPLAQKIGNLTGQTLTASDLGTVFGVATGITPVLMITGGYINDRFGPKLIISLGGIFIGAGYILCAMAQSVSMLYFSYGILVGVGTGMVNGCTINSAVKLFPDRRGFAGGTVTAFLGVGAACLPFAVNGLINQFGVSTACAAFGLFAGVLIPLCGLFTFKCPEDFVSHFAQSAEKTSKASVDVNWVGMIKSPLFIPLFLLFITGSTMGLMLISSLSGIAQTQIGMSLQSAALAVSVISIANTCGRFFSGVISDLIGRVQTLVVMLFLAIVGFVLLIDAGRGQELYFMLGIIAVGLCYGAFIGTYPSLVADEFGNTHNSVNFSLMMTGYSVGGLGGPILLRWAANDGSFSGAYWLCIGAAVLGMVCAAVFLLLKHRLVRKVHI